MSLRSLASLAILLAIILAAGGCKPAAKPAAERYFGIHLDFHAGPANQDIGANTTQEMVQAIIDIMHPDFIQTDCKGHPGYSSYPTKVGNPAPGLAINPDGSTMNPLRIWREVTARNGVALYMHYSGVLDARAIELHPGWASIDPAGNIRSYATSVFGPYADSLLIPQLKELAGEYGVDGMWVDGECWGTNVDYCETAVDAFRKQTGFEPPKNPGDSLWYEWKQFNREAFRQYLRHYIDAVHAEYPDFRICSNWSYTHHMPEPVSAPLDFLSGDNSPLNSVNYGRIASRYVSSQGMPWDLMIWSFAKSGDSRVQKTAVQLMREAAVIISQGGGFSAYYTQQKDGSVDLEKLLPMAEVAKFVRERQPYCFRTTTVPQIALLYSTWDYQHRDDPKNPNCLYPTLNDRVDSLLQGLLESRYSVDLMGEETLLANMKNYPLIVIPDAVELSPEFEQALKEYSDQGGKVLRLSNDRTEIRQRVSELFPEPMVEIDCQEYVDLALRRHNGKLQLHLVNTSGDHSGTPVIEEIPPVENIRISVRLPRKPRRIICQPSGEELPFTFSDGIALFTLPKLDIYDIIEVS